MNNKQWSPIHAEITRPYSVAIVGVSAIVMTAALGCAMFKSAEHQILVDGHAVGRTLVKDGEALAQIPISILQRASTDDVYRAELLKEAVTAAAIAAK